MTSRSIEGQQRRFRKLKLRISSSANNYLPFCTIPERFTGKACGRPTARADKQGLSGYVCRYHQQFRQRHGSHWCRTPSAGTLNPYRAAAQAYIASHVGDPYINGALVGLFGLIRTAGPDEIATRLTGLPPDQRARIALARLREAGVGPERLLAMVLAVRALIEADPAAVHRVREWRIVAIAKAAHRLASGYHRVWEVRDESGRVDQRTEMHAYPRSSGRVLRYLGEMIEKECELVIDHHLAGVLALKATREGPATAARVTP